MKTWKEIEEEFKKEFPSGTYEGLIKQWYKKKFKEILEEMVVNEESKIITEIWEPGEFGELLAILESGRPIRSKKGIFIRVSHLPNQEMLDKINKFFE